jgi:hypothetical protein
MEHNQDILNSLKFFSKKNLSLRETLVGVLAYAQYQDRFKDSFTSYEKALSALEITPESMSEAQEIVRLSS